MNLKKLLIWAGVALALFFMISAPTTAGHLGHQGILSVFDGAGRLIQFVLNLFNV